MKRQTPNRKPSRPATTPDGREQQLVSLAYDLAEKQLRDGTASSQVVTHLLKASSARERLEQERLKNENLLVSAKIEQMASSARMETLYVKAIDAFRSYAGQEVDEDYEDEY